MAVASSRGRLLGYAVVVGTFATLLLVQLVVEQHETNKRLKSMEKKAKQEAMQRLEGEVDDA